MARDHQKYIDAARRYQKTEKYRVAYARAYRKWEKSEKGRMCINKYRHSARGVAANARRNNKRRLLIKKRNLLSCEEWEGIKILYRNICAYCGKGGIKLTMDHVVPLTRGGEHIKENVVPACQGCNSKKGNRMLDGVL